MKPAGTVCKFGAIGDIFLKHGKWFSEHPALAKAGIIDPGRLLKMKFEQVFNRPLDEFDIMNLSKVDAETFKDELGFVVKSLQKGKVSGEIRRVFVEYSRESA